MGFFGRLFGKKDSGINTDLSSGYGQANSGPDNQSSFTEGSFSDGPPPSFDDDFTRNNFPEDGSYTNNSYPASSGQFSPQTSMGQFTGEGYSDKIKPGMEVTEMPTEAEKFQQQSGGKDTIQKDLEIISSKLDALKSSVENIDQRVRKIEKIAEDSQSPPKRPSW